MITNTIQDIVEKINSIYGPQSAEEIAADYAIDAAQELASADTLNFHLECLAENGAKFNQSQALSLAIEQIGA